MINLIKKCPLAFSVILTFLLLNIVGLSAIYNGAITLNITFTHPLIASAIEYISEKAGSLNSYEYDETPITAARSFDVNAFTQAGTDADATGDGTAAGNDDQTAADSAYGKIVYTERVSAAPRSSYYTEVNVKASSSQVDFATVDADFFDNTLFIGDSRIEGLCRYGGLDGASYCFKSGVNVWNLQESAMTNGELADTTLIDALSEKKFDYIYMMIGINELGKGTPTSFANQYNVDISFIRQYQPDAIIVIMGILGITDAYSDSSDVFNNDNVNARNVSLSYLADGNTIFYLDVNDSVCDENGAMIEELSRDGIHLKAEYYTLWADYLCTHAIIK